MRSCEQSVEMRPHGSLSAEAVAQDPASNSADSSPACDPASKPPMPSRDAGQVRLTAPGRQQGWAGAWAGQPVLLHESPDATCGSSEGTLMQYRRYALG